MRAKLKRILEENSARKNRISEQLREEPNSIERYITLLEYTRRPELFADIARTEKELATANLVCRTMEENYVEFEEDTYSWSLQSLAWVKGVQLLLRRAQRKLDVVRPTFRREVSEKTDRLFEDFYVAQQKIREFPANYELRFFRDNLRGALDIQETLQQLIATGNGLRAQQRTLGYEESNFNPFRLELESFQKNVEFWEFC